MQGLCWILYDVFSNYRRWIKLIKSLAHVDHTFAIHSPSKYFSDHTKLFVHDQRSANVQSTFLHSFDFRKCIVSTYPQCRLLWALVAHFSVLPSFVHTHNYRLKSVLRSFRYCAQQMDTINKYTIETVYCIAYYKQVPAGIPYTINRLTHPFARP